MIGNGGSTCGVSEIGSDLNLGVRAGHKLVPNGELAQQIYHLHPDDNRSELGR